MRRGEMQSRGHTDLNVQQLALLCCDDGAAVEYSASEGLHLHGGAWIERLYEIPEHSVTIFLCL